MLGGDSGCGGCGSVGGVNRDFYGSWFYVVV